MILCQIEQIALRRVAQYGYAVVSVGRCRSLFMQLFSRFRSWFRSVLRRVAPRRFQILIANFKSFSGKTRFTIHSHRTPSAIRFYFLFKKNTQKYLII